MTYIPYLTSVADMRANAGVTDSMATDDQLLESIQEAEEYIHRKCRQKFKAEPFTLVLNGTGKPNIHLPSAIVRTVDSGDPGASITAVTIAFTNTPFTVAMTDLVIYDATPDLDGRDDRMNAKIEWKVNNWPGLIVNGVENGGWRPFGRSIFPRGRNNVTIAGTFGFVESDGAPPVAIRRAARALTLLLLSGGGCGDPLGMQKLLQLRIKSETTDDHSYELDGTDEDGDIGYRWIDRRLARYTRRLMGSTTPRIW